MFSIMRNVNNGSEQLINRISVLFTPQSIEKRRVSGYGLQLSAEIRLPPIPTIFVNFVVL